MGAALERDERVHMDKWKEHGVGQKGDGRDKRGCAQRKEDRAQKQLISD
jgi:hypothetical protein